MRRAFTNSPGLRPENGNVTILQPSNLTFVMNGWPCKWRYPNNKCMHYITMYHAIYALRQLVIGQIAIQSGVITNYANINLQQYCGQFLLKQYLDGCRGKIYKEGRN